MFKIIPPNTFVLFPFITGFVVYVYIKIKQSNNGSKKEVKEIIEREKKARLVPKQPLPEDFVLSINQNLPFDKIQLTEKNQRAVKRLQEDILSLSKKKLLNPSINLSNIELKEAYGYKSMDSVISYEKNHSKYIISLNSLAKVLIDSKQENLAEIFLLEAIKAGSDTSKTYIYLIDVYKEISNEKLDNFIAEFKENNNVSNFVYNKTLEHYKKVIK